MNELLFKKGRMMKKLRLKNFQLNENGKKKRICLISSLSFEIFVNVSTVSKKTLNSSIDLTIH